MCISGGKKCSFFKKFGLFSWNTRFEIRPFALLPTKWLFDYFMQYIIRNGKVNPKLFTILQLCCQGIYLFRVNNGNTKLIERRCSGVFTVNFEHILHTVDFEQSNTSWVWGIHVFFKTVQKGMKMLHSVFVVDQMSTRH